MSRVYRVVAFAFGILDVFYVYTLMEISLSLVIYNIYNTSMDICTFV